MSDSELGSIFAGVEDLVGLVRFSGACVVGYRDRLCPGLGYGEARNELYRRVMSEGAFATSPPGWLETNHSRAVGYIVIGEDIVLPLAEDTQTRPLVAMTAICRGSGSSSI